MPTGRRETILRLFHGNRIELQSLYYIHSDEQSVSRGDWLGQLPQTDVTGRNTVKITSAALQDGVPTVSIMVELNEAVLMVQVDLHKLSMQQGLQNIRLGESGHPYLLDSNGVIISHRHSRFVGRNVGELVSMKDGRPGSVDMFTGATFSFLEYSMESTGRMAGVVPLPQLGLIVGFSQSVAEMNKPVLFLRRGLWLFVFLLILVVIGTGLLLGRMVTKPLNVILGQLKLIQLGNVCSLTGGGHSPEIGLIRSAVNMLISRLYETSVSTVASLALTLEARDPATKGHSQKVATIAGLIAETMGYSGKDLRVLARAAMLHDIGKIAIPDTILLKASKLSSSECRIIREHPTMGKKCWLLFFSLRRKLKL